MKDFRRIKRSILLGIILFTTITAKISAQTLVEKINEKSDSLQTLIETAKTDGHDVTKEEMTHHTAQLFLTWAQWDEDHISLNKTYYDVHPYYKNESQKHAEELPTLEREGVIVILDDAISTLKKVISGEFTRKDAVDIDWATVSFEGDRLLGGGEPVFLADYTWKHSIADLEKYYGQLDGEYITPNYISDDQGTVKQWKYDEVSARDDGKIGTVFLDNNIVPDWAVTKYPDIKTGGRHYGKYDPDHAGSREMYSLLFEKFVPLMAGKKYSELGYMLFNEPSYFTKEGSWNNADDNGVCVSDSTIKKFRTWLSEQYTNISELNTLWNKSFASFDAVVISLPISGSKQGTPEWYDWMTFNNYRITEWFKFIKAEIRKYDPAAKVHIKLMPWLFAGNPKDHGMDFEALTELSDIIGCDAGSQYLASWGGEPWKDKYALNWREPIMTFDFFKSVQPNQLIFDTENHFLMKTAFVEKDLNQDYVNAIYWLAAMHGLTATSTWVWGRDEDGSIITGREEDGGYIVSAAHQPKTLNTVTSLFMDLNTFSNEIVAMQNMTKPIRVFYSNTSGINNSTYMDKVYETYSSVFFEGVPVGFATENILGKTIDWEVVLVNNTEYVTDSEFNALQSYLNNGGTVIIDTKSLTKTEYNKARTGSLQPGTGKLIQASSLEDMKTKAFAEIAAKDLTPPIEVTETNSVGSDGCAWKYVKNDAGNYILSVVNIGKSNANININLKNASVGTKCTDLFTGKEVLSNPTLKPFEVYFVEITDEAGIITSVDHGKGTPAKRLNATLYPTLSEGRFTVSLPSAYVDCTITIFNTQGQTIKEKSYSGSEKVDIDISSNPGGAYYVNIISEGRNATLKYFKVNSN